MAKILVTGATGNIGSQLVPRLLSRGHSVRALTRKGEKASFPAGVEVAEGDLTDKGSLSAAVKGVSRMYLLGPRDTRDRAARGQRHRRGQGRRASS